MYVWGSNSHGQLGLGRYIREIPYPKIIDSFSGIHVVDVVAGQYHSMALTSTGKVYTWGWGIHGQLGHGTCDNEYYPRLLEFPLSTTQIAAGHAHSLILCGPKLLFGFGSNAFGQLEVCSIKDNKTTRPTLIVISPDICNTFDKIATSYFQNVSKDNVCVCV